MPEEGDEDCGEKDVVPLPLAVGLSLEGVSDEVADERDEDVEDSFDDAPVEGEDLSAVETSPLSTEVADEGDEDVEDSFDDAPIEGEDLSAVETSLLST